ncbi:MAG TPA: GAF domain-containing SpoIIE family protein phosphatase [Rhodothermales bacterium]|nr:GAF domain-containing SpoIIE family protein phosphatase [Rhodothermales bacterium]
MRRVLLAIGFLVTYAAGFAYQFFVFESGQAPPLPYTAAYHLAVMASFACLWLLLTSYHQERQSTPARTLWSTFLLGIILLGAGYLVLRIGRPAGMPPDMQDVTSLGFALRTGVPLTLATVFKMNVISLLEAAFAFVLLLRLSGLALFKRTKTSQRNWHLMLLAMALASVTAFLKSPQTDWVPVQAVAIVPAVGLMIVNSFRLSWIVLLNFREKMLSIGLLLLLLVLLVAGIGINPRSLLPGSWMLVQFYSYPLSVFTQLAIIFGILYSTTAFLSLLFHLPTTGAFQQKASELAAMHSLTALVSQVFDPERLVHTITASPVLTGSARAAWLALPDPQSGTLRPRIVATSHIPLLHVEHAVDTAAFFSEICLKREPILLNQAPADHRITVRPGDGLGSLLVLPLITRDNVLGALFLTREVTHGFEKDDVEAATVFAAQAALALDHARLFEEQLEKERLSREIDIAREVQRKLLPQKLPCMKGISIGASSVSAQEVGGDFYDFVELDEHRIAFIIADVSGKGTSAAFYMAEMQGIFQSLSRIVPSPADFLSHANTALSRALEKHVFISVIYGVVDLEHETVSLARAGHCPAAFINLNGEARFVRTRGLGLGLDRSLNFRKTIAEEKIRLQPGDAFVLYTDGVVESRNPAGEEFGYERLLDALCEHRHEDAPGLHDALLNDLCGFMGEKSYDDDMTLVVLKWHGISLASAAPHLENKGARDGISAGIAAEEPQPIL